MTKVFVYGTLKSDHGNNTLLERAKFIGEAVTKNLYYLTTVGFPYMIPKDMLKNDLQNLVSHVKGELYEISPDDTDTLENLDWLEGVECFHYKHHETELIGDDGEEHKAISYVPCSDDAQLHKPCKIVDNTNEVFKGVSKYYEY